MKSNITIKRKGILKQTLIIKGNCLENIKLYIDNNYTPLSDNYKKVLPKGYNNIKIYQKINNEEKLIGKYKNKKTAIFLGKLYKISGLYYFEKFLYLFKKSFYFAWHRHHLLIPPKVLKKYIKSFFVVLKRGSNKSNLFTNKATYHKWLKENNEVIDIVNFKYNPLISIIIPTYNVSADLLTECLDSVLCQTYQNFEICIADDNSKSEETINTIREYLKKDKRIKAVFRKKNGMISAASNSAIELASGEYLAFLDNDDVLDKNALYYMISLLNKNKKLDMIYSDEDKLNEKGEYLEPHFKPDYSPETFMCLNYICHFTLLRKKIVDEIGGFRSKYDGAQDYDLFLRFTEKTNNIAHIDKILYHWRQSRTSTAGYLGNKSYAYIAGKRALEDALKRRKIAGEVLDNKNVTAYLVKYHHNNPLVSIIIPMKDKCHLTKKCIDSLFTNTYQNFEIIIANNNSVLKETKEFFKEYQEKYNNIKVIDINQEFNYAKINNEAVKHAKGEYLLLLNNDTMVIDKNFLDFMLGYASQRHIGAVGIKLLYEDNKVQHAGVVLGYGGVAGHIYVPHDKDDVGLFGRLVMPYNYTAVTAACLLIKKDKFLEVSGFDENLKVALNDVDLCLQLLEKGYYNVCLSNITMYHLESKSRGFEDTNEKHNRFIKEQNYMKEKWKEKLDNDLYFSKNNF